MYVALPLGAPVDANIPSTVTLDDIEQNVNIATSSPSSRIAIPAAASIQLVATKPSQAFITGVTRKNIHPENKNKYTHHKST